MGALQRELGGGFVVTSAGLDKTLAGRPANRRSVACMQERGLDLSGHTSRWIGSLTRTTAVFQTPTSLGWRGTGTARHC